MFRHPKYYKELRLRNKSDQVISPRVATASARRAPDSGPKQQAQFRMILKIILKDII
jgi:hypothetical protein